MPRATPGLSDPSATLLMASARSNIGFAVSWSDQVSRAEIFDRDQPARCRDSGSGDKTGVSTTRCHGTAQGQGDRWTKPQMSLHCCQSTGGDDSILGRRSNRRAQALFPPVWAPTVNGIEADDLPPVDSLPRSISFVTSKRATGELPFTVETLGDGRPSLGETSVTWEWTNPTFRQTATRARDRSAVSSHRGPPQVLPQRGGRDQAWRADRSVVEVGARLQSGEQVMGSKHCCGHRWAP